MKFKLLLALVVLFIVSTFSDAKAYNLKDAITAVLQNNEKIQALRKKLEIAMLQKPKVVAEFLPNVALELNETFHKNRNFDNPSNPIKYHQGSLILNIEQEIYSGGSTIAKIIAADAEANVAYQDYIKELNDVIYQTINVYQGVLTNRELIKIQIQNVAMAEKHLEKARIMVKSRAYTKSFLYLAKANLSEIKQHLEEYKVNQVEVEAYFQYYIGEKAPEKMEEINLKQYKAPTLEDFKSLVNQKNPDILKAKSELKASKQGINIATSRLMPKISLFGQLLRQDGPSHLSNNTLFKQQIRKDGDTYGVKMTIPVFSRGLEYLNISEAKKKKKLSEHSLKSTVYGIQANVTTTWDKYVTNDIIYNLSRQAEKDYYQTYLSIQAEFDVGAVTIFDVIKRQQEYNHHTVTRLQKEKDSKLALFGIYKLIGNLPQAIKDNNPIIKN